MEQSTRTRPVTATLDDEHADYAEETVATGRYESVDAMVREGLDRIKAEDDWLRAEIQKGFDDIEAGRYHDFDTAEDLIAYLDANP